MSAFLSSNLKPQAVTSSSEVRSHDQEIRSVTSRHAGTVPYINAREAGNEESLLAEIGYKQELKRNFSTFQVFGIAFSIMGILPSIVTCFYMNLAGGPVTMVWGWLLASAFILTIGISMSEMASSIPTSGGLYYWTHYYSPPSMKAPLSFLIGVFNFLSLTSAVASITYGFAQQLLAAVYIGSDSTFEITDANTFGVYVAAVIFQFFLTGMASGAVSRLQSASIVANLGIVVLFFISLPIGTIRNVGHFNDAKYIFGKFENLTDWPSGWTFFLCGFMPPVWTIGAFDCCVHMAEEARHPTRACPIGIVGSISACGILGFLCLVVCAACMNPDLDALINSDTGQPFAQLYLDSLGKKWAIAFMSLCCVCQMLMSASCMVAGSRQCWAFARDNGMPFSRYLKVVNKPLSTPLRAVMFSTLVSLLLGLLILAGSTAASALFSISNVGSYLSWSVPPLLRLTSGKDIFQPGPFYLGDVFSPIVNWIAIFFQFFIIILSLFPESKEIATPADMNYAVVVNCGVAILTMAYYYAYKYKYYHGPLSNLDDDELDVIEAPNIDETINNASDVLSKHSHNS